MSEEEKNLKLAWFKNVQFIILCGKLSGKNFETKKRGAEKQNAHR